jgi:polyvinyl alcohol dehydrogenase (cytochrome)
MYGQDMHHSFAKSGSLITKANLAQLTLAWTFNAGDAVSASPTVVGGVVYVGAWDGFFYALDAASGTAKWKFQLDCQPAIVPVPPQCLADGQAPPDRSGTDGGIVVSSAAVVSGRVYFGGGKTLYCLNASDGSLVWKTVLCGNPDQPNCQNDPNDPTNIFSSPVVYDGKVYVGHTPDGRKGYRGRAVALDAATGSIAWTFEVDPILDPNGKVIGGNNRGCGSVWSSIAIDEINYLAIFGTGDCQNDATPPYHEAVVAVDASSGVVTWTFRPRSADTCDFDFGSSANVLDLDGQRYVGIGSKDGTYYVLGSHNGQLAWSRNVVFGGSSGGFIGTAAFDGQRIYGATALGELGGTPCDPTNPRDTTLQNPSYHAFDARKGTVLWEDSQAYSFAASTVAGGVVFNGVGLPLPSAQLRAYDATSGALLRAFPAGGAVNAGATIVGKRLFYGTGNSFNGQGGAVLAYSLP